VIAQDSKNGAVLTVHVQPNAPRTECIGILGDALKIRVAAPSLDGAANEELIRFIAGICAIPRASVLIRSGIGRRRKRLYLKGIRAEAAMSRFLAGGQKGAVNL